VELVGLAQPVGVEVEQPLRFDRRRQTDAGRARGPPSRAAGLSRLPLLDVDRDQEIIAGGAWLEAELGRAARAQHDAAPLVVAPAADAILEAGQRRDLQRALDRK